MKEFIKNMFSSGANVSSARIVNILGAVAMTAWMTTITAQGNMNAELLSIYALYCAGVYGSSKFLDTKMNKNEVKEVKEVKQESKYIKPIVEDEHPEI